MAKKKPDPVFANRFNVACTDTECWRRPCMWPGEDKGSYVQGRGYINYYEKPRLVCSQRHLHGCPHPLPEPDTELARCCYRPTYQYKLEAPTGWKTCAVCGAQAPLRASKVLNALPTLPGVPCSHTNAGKTMILGWFECPHISSAQTLGCGGIWDHRPQRFEPPQYTVEEMCDLISEKLRDIAPGVEEA